MERNNKGISLIVLVITVIVMIILAGSVIISLSNSGIIGKAKEAVDERNLKQVEQIAALAWSEAYIDKMTNADVNLEDRVIEALAENKVNIDKYIITVTNTGVRVILKHTSTGWMQTGHTITDGTTTLTVGDYIDYKANVSGYTDENGWRVLGAENGELLIVSAGEVVDTLTLGGSTLEEAKATYAGGALTALQEAVNAYGNGDKATGVRSIKGEDIDRIAQYDITTFKGEDYIQAYMEVTGATQSQVLEILGANDISEFNIMNYGTTVTFSWDDTNVPIYNYINEGETVTGSLYSEHSKFVWHDGTVWRTADKANSGVITDGIKTASITNNFGGYIGTKLGEDTAAYEMLIENEEGELSYWLASPFSHIYEIQAGHFGLRYVFQGLVDGFGFLDTVGDQGYFSSSYGVRAVVYLESDIQLAPNGTNAWTIMK